MTHTVLTKPGIIAAGGFQASEILKSAERNLFVKETVCTKKMMDLCRHIVLGDCVLFPYKGIVWIFVAGCVGYMWIDGLLLVQD